MFARLHTLRTRLRRFRRARRGSAAVEFAIVVLPFFMLTAGLAEVAMIGFAQASLDFAVSEAGRQIRTGQAQTGGVTATQIQQQICTQMNQFMVLSCGGLFLDVKRFNSFVDAGANGNTDPMASGAFDPSGFQFSPGAASDIVVVRAYYRWHILTPMFEPIFGNDGGDRVLVSTLMFRNEPW